jgi:hypothetical protein
MMNCSITHDLLEVQIPQMLPGGNLPHLLENVDWFRTLSF